MKTSVVIYIFALLISVSAFAADNVAVILKVKGSVTIERAENHKKISGKIGMPLQNGDKVITGNKSFTAVRFLDDKSMVRVRANSICTIEGKKSENKIEKSIWIEVGTFFMDIFKQKGSFKVITPTSVASIKGTKFWAIHSHVTGSRYIGIEGLIEIKNDKGKALLKAGETALVETKNSPPKIRITKDGDLPKDAEEIQGKILEIQFENEDGIQKEIRIKLEKSED